MYNEKKKKRRRMVVVVVELGNGSRYRYRVHDLIPNHNHSRVMNLNWNVLNLLKIDDVDRKNLNLRNCIDRCRIVYLFDFDVDFDVDLMMRMILV